MLSIETNKILLDEVKIAAIRASGKGGQNVNKVSSKIQLNWNLHASNAFPPSQIELLKTKLKNKLDQEGNLQIMSQESRSQLANKKLAIQKFFQLIEYSLQEQKKRVPTNKTAASNKQRLNSKKILSEKKSLRKFKLD